MKQTKIIITGGIIILLFASFSVAGEPYFHPVRNYILASGKIYISGVAYPALFKAEFLRNISFLINRRLASEKALKIEIPLPLSVKIEERVRLQEIAGRSI